MRYSALPWVIFAPVLLLAGCTQSDDVYWDAFSAGEEVAGSYETPSQPADCSGKEGAEAIMCGAGWNSPTQFWIDDECGSRMPDTSERQVWMEGCRDGANDSPNYEQYGPRP
ncbi:hypothetical protein [Streptomyces tibetensis]|uniref:hypothetical protein n=1 Tax=Streptomyces tibetensis TaxID=2382123 RepID=UPI0033FF1156